MSNTIFEATYFASQQITATFDMVWALDAGLWNLRQDAKKYFIEHPDANNIEVKNTNKIGALPGTAYEKLLPFAMPLADHVGGRQALDMYVNRGTIEVESLSFLRGRDFKKSIIAVMLGVCLAAIIITVLTLMGFSAFTAATN